MDEEDYTDGSCEVGSPMPKNATGAWWHHEARQESDGGWHCPVCGERWHNKKIETPASPSIRPDREVQNG